MKRAFSLVMLAVLFSGILGVMPLFFLKQAQIRNAVKHKLKTNVPTQELHAVRFGHNEAPVWVRPGKEFKRGGHFFDIVRTETDLKGTIYYCINDTEERMLFGKLDFLCQQQTKQNGDPAGTAVQQFIKLFSFDLPTINSSCLLPATCCFFTTHHLLPTPSPFLSPPTPPPDHVG